MKIRFLFYFLILSRTFSAQFLFDFNDSISVKLGNDTLFYPWAGGLNYAQFSDIDIDFDGDLDLFIFDRSKDNIRLFRQVLENGQKKYKAVHNAKNYFPTDFKNRVALLDYNLDGKNDIFTYGIGGVKVYKNTGNVQNGLSWELTDEILKSDYNGDFSNLYVSSADIPAYIDVDFDGDIDVLTFDISGERLQYHQNQSQELYNHSDSLIFVLKNECWGKFTEDAITSEIVLNATETPCTSGNVPNPQLGKNPISEIEGSNFVQNLYRHAGSTVLALDIDNSGVLDVVLGDVNLRNLVLLTNDGVAPNTNSAMISMEENFPSNTTPVNMSIFPASFYIDVDFDEVKDLLVCPNAKSISQNEKSVFFYKNLGTNTLPNFSFRSKSYFQEEMIEVGTGSIPMFVDQNGDGLEDLFVANFYKYKEPLAKESTITNYRNIGTLQEPFFSFVESNFLALNAQSYGLRSVPTFGDIDSDGDKDLLLGLENGTVSYYQNTAGAGTNFSFANPISSYTDNLGSPISAQNYCFPQLFDLNDDGLLDLILGKKTGELMYYENVGTPNIPSFELKNDTLGGIDISTLTPEGYASPHFFKFQDTIRLFLGGFDGKIRFYDDIKNNLQNGDSFHLISDNFLNITTEAYSSCWVNDIDSDGNLDLFVGGDLGGVFHLEHNINSTLELNEETKNESEKAFSIYPNPTSGMLNLKFKQNLDENTTIEIFNSLGEKLFYSTKLVHEINLSEFENGIYFLKIGENNQSVLKIIKN